jgi:hypothetical protein
MLDGLEDIKQYGSVGVILISIFAILISGIFFGATYYLFDSIETAFENTDCVIENNVFVETCQDLWDLSIYPFLALRELLIWFSFFFIFSLVISILVLGYQSGNSPVLMGALVVIVSVISYISIEVSNVYRTLLENDLFRSMMVDFTVYNKIMLYFPWFMFIVSLFAVMMGIVNWQKTRINTPTGDLDY